MILRKNSSDLNLEYKQISHNEYDNIREIFLHDMETSKYFLWVLENEPETLKVVYLANKVVALVQIIPGKKVSFLNVFVVLQWRKKGIGEAVVHYGESILQEAQAKEIMTNFNMDNEVSVRFARRFGYIRKFSSAYMKHEKGKFLIGNFSIRQYRDIDYPQSHALYAQAFHEMRVKVGDFPDSIVEQPSNSNRQAWKEDAANRFSFEENSQIVGHGHLEGNEIGSISVRTDLQRHGLGKKLLMYLCNEIYNRGYKEVVLWCVVGNNAKRLYNSLGFKELYVAEFATKIIKSENTKNI